MRLDQHIRVNGESVFGEDEHTLQTPKCSSELALAPWFRCFHLYSFAQQKAQTSAAAPGETPIVRLQTMQSDDALNTICKSRHGCYCPLKIGQSCVWVFKAGFKFCPNMQNVVTYLGFLWYIVFFLHTSEIISSHQSNMKTRLDPNQDSAVITL